MSLESEITEALENGESLESVARKFQLSLASSVYHLYGAPDAILLPGWAADDGNCEVQFPLAQSGEDACQDYVDTGEWGSCDSSFAVAVKAWRVGIRADGATSQWDETSTLIVVHPEEPECQASITNQHRWRAPFELVGGIKENPGCWTTQGCGMHHVAVCTLCGTARHCRSATQGVDTEYDHDTENYEEGYISIERLVEYWDGDEPPDLHEESDLAEALAEEEE